MAVSSEFVRVSGLWREPTDPRFRTQSGRRERFGPELPVFFGAFCRDNPYDPRAGVRHFGTDQLFELQPLSAIFRRPLHRLTWPTRPISPNLTRTPPSLAECSSAKSVRSWCSPIRD